LIKSITLPSNWQWCEAQDYIDVRDGTHDSPKYIEEGTPLVTSKNLINGKIDFSTCSYISEKDHQSISKRSAVHDGDILYAMIGTIGNPVIVDKKHAFSIKNVALFKFKNANIFNRYVYYYLNTPLVTRQFERSSRGGTQKFVSLRNIRELKIPLPPLYEQKKIAAILDAADALRQKDAQLIAKYNALSQSLFLDMFGDPVTNPMGWEIKPLGELFKLSSGKGLTAKNMTKGGKFPVYGGNGINGYHSESMFEKPQLIIGRVGVYCGVIHITKPYSWVTDNALYVKEKLMPFNDVFMAQLLELANLNQYAGKAAQPLVSGSRIHPLEMINPPLELQNQFAERIKHIEAQKQQAQASLQKSEDLFNSLLQRAFKGELTA